MNKTSVVYTFIIAMALTSAALAQPEAGRTVVCKTSDGIVQITSTAVLLRDYVFSVDRVLDNGAVLLKDDRAHSSALLESYGDEGLYLAVTDGGLRMQVVADRKNIVSRNAPPAWEPEAERSALLEASPIDLRTVALGKTYAAIH